MRLRHIHRVVPSLWVFPVARSIHPSRSIWRRHLCTCLVETPDLLARLATDGQA
jgi:hypothetical protein